MTPTLDTCSLGALIAASLLLQATACLPADPSQPRNTPPSESRPPADVADTDDGGEQGPDGDGSVEPDTAPDSSSDADDGFDLPVELPTLPEDAEPPWPSEGVVNGAYLEVTHIVDGDTLYVSTGPGSSEETKIRLKGIDTPACNTAPVGNDHWACDPSNPDLSGDGEYYGIEARERLKTLIGDRPVRIGCLTEAGNECETGPYDRYLAWVVVPEKGDVSRRLARSGHAWTFTKFEPPNLADYCRAEDEAKEAERGMWANTSKVHQTMNANTREWYNYRDSVCRKAVD